MTRDILDLMRMVQAIVTRTLGKKGNIYVIAIQLGNYVIIKRDNSPNKIIGAAKILNILLNPDLIGIDVNLFIKMYTPGRMFLYNLPVHLDKDTGEYRYD